MFLVGLATMVCAALPLSASIVSSAFLSAFWFLSASLSRCFTGHRQSCVRICADALFILASLTLRSDRER